MGAYLPGQAIIKGDQTDPLLLSIIRVIMDLIIEL